MESTGNGSGHCRCRSLAPVSGATRASLPRRPAAVGARAIGVRRPSGERCVLRCCRDTLACSRRADMARHALPPASDTAVGAPQWRERAGCSAPSRQWPWCENCRSRPWTGRSDRTSRRSSRCPAWGRRQTARSGPRAGCAWGPLMRPPPRVAGAVQRRRAGGAQAQDPVRRRRHAACDVEGAVQAAAAGARCEARAGDSEPAARRPRER